MHDPYLDCDSLEDASDIASFDISVSDVINDYSNGTISAISGDMIEVVYQNKDKEIRIRKVI